jgi:lipopolysaccharide biosynthesis protein
LRRLQADLAMILGLRRKSRDQEQTDYQLIASSGLFDRAWYFTQYLGLDASTIDPALHYVCSGAREGRNPNALFDGKWYLAQYPDVKAAGLNPLVHYLVSGAAQGRDPGPFFDTQWYLAQHPTLNAITGSSCLSGKPPAAINPLADYLQNGWHRGVLPFDPARLLSGIKVAVVVHLFYADLWDEIAGWLCNIPIAFDLFVSVPRENSHALRNLVLREHPNAQVIEVANAGRDIGAFFAVLPRLLAGNYSVICKLHSKKGLERPQAWRDLLLRGLLANKMLVARILYAFAHDGELVLAGPRQAYVSGPAQMMHNREKVIEIAGALLPRRRLPPRWGFFAGTMFWARPDFFRPFLQCNTQIQSFEVDNTRHDGQLAHGYERMFGALATMTGKRIGLTDLGDRGPLDGMMNVTQAPGHPWEGSFMRVLKSHALRLSGELPFAPAPHGRAQRRGSTRAQELIKGIESFAAQRTARVREGYPIFWRHARRPIKLAWWTATLQLFPRLRSRYDIQALVASSTLFDRDWYLDRYPDVRAEGVDPAFHYVRRGLAEYRDPSPLFDTGWYATYYPDIAAAGVNPLVHYLRKGAKEGRHPHPSHMVIGEVTDAVLSCRKPADASGETALFVTHAPDGRLRRHVRHYLEALRRHGIKPVLIVAADGEFREADESLLALLAGLYVRQNVGFDFAAWAHALRQEPGLLNADILYLINDSMLGPLNEAKFAEVLRRVRSSPNDLVGLTDSYERQWHIQSYFIALNSAALASPTFRAFFMKVKNLSSKVDVVFTYETRLAPTMQAAGLRCEVLFPARKAHNRSLEEWRELIGSGFPFVKLAALRDQSLSFGTRDWRKILQAEGFDCGLAEEALAYTAETAS